MDLFWLKLLSSVLIFLIAALAGCLPIICQDTLKESGWLEHAGQFARGIFLGAGMIHLIPDAYGALLLSGYTIKVPIIAIITISTICALLALELVLTYYIYKQDQPYNRWVPILLFVLLSFHSLIAGAALGLQIAATHILVLLLAILAHKGSAAFALAMTMQSHHLNQKKSLILLSIFSIMTPLGIQFGNQFQTMAQNSVGLFISALLNAFAAGIFIYIALFDKISHKNFSGENRVDVTACTMYFLGLIMMAIIGIAGL